MTGMEIQFVHDQAEYTCETCKRRKRKCDKLLPRCSFCTRKEIACSYSFATSLKSQDASSQPKSPGDDNLAQRSRLPSVFFLDHDIFQQGQMEIPTPLISIPSYVSGLLGSTHEFGNVALEYFATVHTYLAIVSKKNFYGLLMNPLLQRRADVAFLCLCMKLVTWKPSEVGISESEEYVAARRYMFELEAAGVFTLQVLQGRMLVAFFELGHAMYPVAYMSVNACASHGLALGLDKESEQTVGAAKILSWVEEEERRRMWWAIIILERISHLGSRKRPLMTKNPDIHDILPADDVSWDKGIMTPSYRINGLPSNSEINMGRFARSAHAIHLLSLVVRHITTDFPSPSLKEEEVIQLDRTLHSLIMLCRLESTRTQKLYCNPVAICSSALLMLHGHYLYPGFSAPEYQRERSWRAIVDLCRDINAEALRAIAASKVVLLEVSPFAVHSNYKAAEFLVQMNREFPDEQMVKWVGTMKDTLTLKDKRWKLSGAYLRILEAKQVIHAY